MTEINPNGVNLRTGIYGVFDEFLKKSVIEKESFFSENNQKVFKPEVLKDIVDWYVKKPNTEKNIKFVEKAKKQLADIKNNQADAKAVFANLMWLQYLPARKPLKDNNEYGVNKCKQIEDITEIKVSYSCDGRAKYGMAAMRLDDDLTDLILLFNELVGKQWDGDENKKLGSIKDYIIRWCLDLKEDDKSEKGIRETAYDQLKTKERKCPADLLPIHNMLLHLCKPQHYDDISVSGHKKKIVETFGALIPKKEDGNYSLKTPQDILDDANAYNKKYYIILNELNKLKKRQLVMNISIKIFGPKMEKHPTK